MRLILKDILGNTDLLSRSLGHSLYTILEKEIKKNNSVKLSFDGIELCSSAFLNASIGKIYIRFHKKDVDSLLEITDVTNYTIKETIADVIENSKDYEYHESLMDGVVA